MMGNSISSTPIGSIISRRRRSKSSKPTIRKTYLCEQHGIKLYRVPYWVKFEALPEFMSDAIGIAVSTPFDPGRKLGINMTACYTGASLAKKTIFAKHYKQLKENPAQGESLRGALASC